MTRSIKVAAVQPALALADVDNNLARLDSLIRDAHRAHQPDVIIVPEAASAPNVHHPAMRSVARPSDGAPFQLYTGLARELGVVIGGGFLAQRGNDVFNTYVLAEPDGTVNTHDKDIPTMYEQHYYRGGTDNGIVSSPALGTVGLVCGWEWARYRTSARLRGNVDVVLGGMCWPTVPFLDWSGPLGWLGRQEHKMHLPLARKLPGQVARLVGVPIVHASHVGPIEGYLPMLPGLSGRVEMVGETQICERDGTILGRLSYDDGEGHIAANIEIGDPTPLDRIEDRYWIPEMTPLIRATWDLSNIQGAASYRARKLVGRHVSR